MAALRTTRAHVLAFRLRRHNLAERLSRQRMADAVAVSSIRNSPPGSAQAALLARVDDISEDRVAASLSSKAVVEVLGPRMAPAFVRHADIEVFTVGGIGAGEGSLKVTVGRKVAKSLAEAGLRLADALTLVIDAAADELAGGARAKGDLSAAMTARLPAAMSSWCEVCGSRHIEESLFRLPGAVGGYCIPPRAGREVSYILVREWLGRQIPPVGSAAAVRASAELVRRFLRCYGPAAPDDFADWTKTGVMFARELFAGLAGDLQEVSCEGRAGWVLCQDVDDLRQAELPSGVRLLPPGDPYLNARDRATLVPDPAQRNLVWRSIVPPGAVLADGEITATWRAQKSGATLRVRVSPLPHPSAPAIARLQDEAQRLAKLRGFQSADVSVGAP